MFPAWVLLSFKATMVRIVEFHDEPMDSVTLLLHINENSTTTIGETVKCVDVVYENDFCADLQLQDRLEGRVLDAPCIVRLELLDGSARIFRFDGELFSLHLVQLRVVPGVDLSVRAIDVDGFVRTGVSAGADSGLQQGNVLTGVISCPHSVQQVPIDLVLSLAMVLLQAHHSEKLPQVS